MDKGRIATLCLFLVAAVVITIQRGVYGFPNDYAIFRASFWNLLAHNDLYALRIEQARDYFKYSPTFALLFAPFALLPFVPGLLAWNIINALAIWFSLNSLLPGKTGVVAQLLIFLPTLRSIQSSQSNSLVAALMVIAFVSYERGWLWRGGGFVALATVIKIFPVAAATLAFPRRDRGRAILIVCLCTIVLVALPLLVLHPAELAALYKSWGALEKSEAALVGSSAMVLIRDAGLNWPAWPVQGAATVLLLGALLYRLGDWEDPGVRLQFLALTLVFCVVFNHRAERQSSVIAICGLVIWLLSRPPAKWRFVLFAIVYALVVLAGTSPIPHSIKDVLSPEMRFTIPLTAAWLAILGEFVLTRHRSLSI
jgi:hypothetical protein